MENKDIICPDCNITYISKEQLQKKGSCSSCLMRKAAALRNNKEYIKFIDLPEKDKAKTLKARKSFSLYNAERSKKVKTQKKPMFSLNSKEVLDWIIANANSDLSVRDMYKLLVDKYPKEKFSMATLYRIYSIHNLPHKAGVIGRPVTKDDENKNVEPQIEVNTINDTNIDDNVDIGVTVNNDDIEDNSIDNVTDVDTEPPTDYKVINEKLPERFNSVRSEVRDIVDKKFKNLKCSVPNKYNTDDYINVIDTLIYLKNNVDKLLKARVSQYNIMNAYQADVVHEAENVVAADGDTYISDKLHVIRSHRRYYETDYKDINVLKCIIDSLDIQMLNNALKSLNNNKKFNDAPIFRPLVDTSMLGKYDWAKEIDSFSVKSLINVANFDYNKNKSELENNLSSNTTESSNKKKTKDLKKFRVSCKVSGGGYGVYSTWYRDYLCMHASTALAYAKNTLTQISNNKKGMMWTKLEVVELDKNYNTGSRTEIINNNISELMNGMLQDDIMSVKIDDTNLTHKYLVSCNVSSEKHKIFGKWNKIYICDSNSQATQAAKDELKEINKNLVDLVITDFKCISYS